MDQNTIDILKRALQRERRSRKQAEEILEAKSAELYSANKLLEASYKELEGLYSQTSSQLQGVFESIADAYVIMDLWGNIIKMNQSAVRLLGFRSKKDEGQLLELVSPSDAHLVKPTFKTLLKKGIVKDLKINIITNSNEHKLVHINLSTIYENGKAVGAQGIVRDITSENKYQNLIEYERKKYSSIIANMNLGLIEVNNNDEILMVNQSFKDMSGYEEHELLGRKCSNIFLDEEAKIKMAKKIKKRYSGKSDSFEIEITTKSGELKQWLVSGAPNYNDKGEVVGSIGIHFDLTEARSNLDLLQQKTEQLDIIFENASMGIVLSRNDTILKCNSTFAQMLNYEKSELEGGHYLSITTEEDRLKSQSYVARMEKGELDNFTLNKRYLKKDGSKIWSKTIVTSVKGPGNLPYHIALIEDITDERNKSLIFKMLNNLTTSILGKIDINEIAWEIVNILANYLESSDCIIYVVDWEKNCLEQIAAYGNKIDKSKNIVNKLTIPIGEGIVGRVAVTGKSELIGDTTKDPNYITDDKLRMSEITVPIIRNNKVIGVIDSEYEDKNYFNSEHLKTLESVASIVGIQLETAVNIRKREKAEAINKELLKQLTNSNNELQEYAHVVSHDLKSPLRSIDALIAWLKEDNNDNLDETSLKNLSLIEITLEKMEQLITDVLNYSSVSEINRQNEIFSSQELVDDVLKILFIPKHIKIHISKDLPIINGDKTKIQQVFINLISNAIKYNDKKEGIIKINTDETSSHYLFSVSDNGIGIDEKYHDKVFKLFHSLETRHDSTGIGLSVVKKIVGLHNGQIWLESELGIGSTFHFSIKK